MGTVINNIENFFKQDSILSKLIAINIVIFILVRLLSVFSTLFGLNTGFITYLELPSSFERMIIQPWSLLTYMFTHYDFLHILFNMLWLYWFGKIFLYFFNPKQLAGIYILGGLVGALFFMVSYNIFPFFSEAAPYSYLMGSSASVMAIVFAAAFYKKDYQINLLFLGNIKIIYLAIITLLIDILAMTSANAGGHIAHIGGALTGIGYAYFIKKGFDITHGLNVLIDFFSNLFKKKKKTMRVTYNRFESDYSYNKKKKDISEEVDAILDKLKKSGYSSLTEEEKKKLFDASKK